MRDGVLQLLDVEKDSCRVVLAQITRGSAPVLLNMIRVRSLFFFDKELPIHTMGNKSDLVGLQLFRAHACEALDQGLDGNGSGELGEWVQKNIEQLTTWAEQAMRTLSGSLTKVSTTELWMRSGEGRRGGRTKLGLQIIERGGR